MSAAFGEYDQEESTRQQAEVENLVAECMAAEGFEYTPQDYSSMSMSFNEDDFADMNTEEWVAKNGYGMSMGMEATEEPTDGEPTQEWVDPNADYVATLSETEMTAFYEVLYGVQPEMTEEEMETYEYNWEDSGCQGSAQHEISGDEQDIYSDPRFEDLMDSMNELYTSAQKDPRVVELSAKWADCMADAGFAEFATPDDAMTSVSEAQNELYSFEGEMAEDYTGPSSEAIAAFREIELSTALADFKCKESVDLAKISQKVQFELEEAFVKDNKAALDEFVAAVQDTRK
ncbi:hypothetical protein SAMN05216410_1722 [Sanguibacter gelidistatuariae]|uniref:Uncharacterized protein n=1 Tax=Sanguibacter gelidistatuariae TaxID=1814289 RepID=A0A1G6KZ16_9MICO|nr:hypothetical protein [Sanguibacter gelidistatuariae]SDC36177.1 hypothetical protein SAMN05216410_1722 [Sanguibacter gelidistatuariae]